MHISPFLLVAALGSSAFGKKTKGPCACSNAALEHCLKTKGVPFKVRCDSDWAEYSTTLNLRLPITPAVIAVPDNTRHVSAAVVCAGRNGVKVQAKSGGRGSPSPLRISFRFLTSNSGRLVRVVQFRGWHRRPGRNRSSQLQQDRPVLRRNQHRRGRRRCSPWAHGHGLVCPRQKGRFPRHLWRGGYRGALHAWWLGIQLTGLGPCPRPHC